MRKTHIVATPHVISLEKRHGLGADLQLKLLLCVTADLEQWSSPNRTAPYWRFYVMGGEGARVKWGGRTQALVKESAWLIAPDTAFETELRAPVTQL